MTRSCFASTNGSLAGFRVQPNRHHVCFKTWCLLLNGNHEKSSTNTGSNLIRLVSHGPS